MVSVYTLTLAPSLDSATLTPQIYPEGKLRCSAPSLNPAAAALMSHAPLPIWVESHGDFPGRWCDRRTLNGAARR
jgi:hypothetical protein